MRKILPFLPRREYELNKLPLPEQRINEYFQSIANIHKILNLYPGPIITNIEVPEEY